MKPRMVIRMGAAYDEIELGISEREALVISRDQLSRKENDILRREIVADIRQKRPTFPSAQAAVRTFLS